MNNLTTFNLKRDFWLVTFSFLAIFQPPFVPIALIYIMGLVTAMLLFFSSSRKLEYKVYRECHIEWMYRLFILMSLYIFIVGFINWSFIEKRDILKTWMKSINQTSVLSFIEFAMVWYILIKSYQRKFGLNDIVTILCWVGILQSICCIAAFISPQIRSIFMMFGDRNLYSNEFFMERRGYGFSTNLLDTFGYGMGLIGGYMILVKWTKSKLLRIISLCLVLFAISVNARTGFVVIFLAVIVKLFISYKGLNRIIILSIAVAVGFSLYSIIPQLLESGKRSDNVTISWISSSFEDIYLLFSTDKSQNLSFEDVSFIDNIIDLPDNAFELLFGTGHYVYDTESSLGFRTDIGYFNLLWEFGIIGTIAVLSCMLYFMGLPFFKTKNRIIRSIVVFNIIAYLIVEVKAILIGYSPGVMVNYIMTFSLYYYLYCKPSNNNSQMSCKQWSYQL